jgi:uncharacterized hydrophobic protein (TIGR00341 family)
MQLQLIEVYAQKDSQQLNEIIDECSIINYWSSNEDGGRKLTRLLVETEDTEKILNYLEEPTNNQKDFEVLLFPVQTYFPRVERDEKKEDEEKEEKSLQRASRHELFSAVESSSEINVSYMWFMIFASVVATVGIIKNSPAVVIGAMVIAPLLGPVTAVSFAAVLGDFKLIRRSLLSSLYGLLIPLIISILFGFYFALPSYSDEFLSRTNIQIIDIVAALAAGAAGALSFVKRMQGTIVGVMVSVALLPPAVVLGMTIGSAEWSEAFTPLLLLMVNIDSILLSAIIVFSLCGIKPVNWEDIQKAHISRTYSLIFISIISLVLIAAIVLLNFDFFNYVKI